MADAKQNKSIDATSPSVQTHLGILQSVIERMAANSTSSKTWCITVVTATLIVAANKDKPDYTLFALVPTLLFLALDVYYLALEKGFRKAYNKFVRKVHNGTLMTNDLYAVKPGGKMSRLRWKMLRSFSVWGFYFFIGILITLVRWAVLP